MKKGTKVSWTTKDGNQGFDICVAVLSDGEKHHVIWCTVTWLTVLA
jgi:hypothetical protein